MKKISIVLIVIINILMPSIVFAANSFQVELLSDKTEVKQGDVVTISISLANLNVTTGEQGIGAYLAKIEYDTEIFEKTLFFGNGNWEGSMENGNITGVTIDGKVVKQTETIATLTLTVKDNAKVGNTTVAISNFVGSDAVNDISANSKSIEIKVIEENKNQNQEDSDKFEQNVENSTNMDSNKNETNIENNTNTESNLTDNNNTNSDASDNTNSNNSANNNNSGTTDNVPEDNVTNQPDENNNIVNSDTNNTVSNEQHPQAGVKIELYGVFIAILLVLIIGIYIYHRKIKLKGKSSK